MIKKISAFICLILCSTHINSQDLIWFNQIKDVYDDIDINDVVLDGSENVYIGGSFDDQRSPVDNSAPAQINFMGNVQTTTHEQMGFLAKLNSSGVLQWLVKFGSPNSTTGYSPLAMAVSNGNLYVVGSFEYSSAPGLDFDPGAGTRYIQSTTAADFFVSKYSCTDGSMIWAYAGFGGGGSDLPSGIVVDASENIYVSGQCNNGATAVDFNIKSPTANASQIGIASTNQLYLVSYDKDCNFRWRKNITNSVTNAFGTREMAIDLVNNYIYMAGGVSQNGGANPNFGGTSLTVDASTTDGFISKWDYSGTLQWVKNVAAGTSGNSVNCIDVDGSGNVYVGGYFQGTADFDPSAGTSNLTSAGSFDAYIAKYNSSGTRQWSYKIGSTSFGEMTNSIKVTSAGDDVVGGALYGAADLNPEGTGGAQTKGAASQRSIFFGQYDSNFKYKWAHALGSGSTNVGTNQATSVTIDQNNSPNPVYVFGYMSYLSTENFNPTGAGFFAPSLVSETATGVTSPSGNQYMGDNGFLAKYSTSSLLLPIELISFEGACINEETNLFWETASENNNAYFTIENSSDAITWNTIQTISSHGNSNKKQNYSFAYNTESSAYYRLKQTDWNGLYKYSQVIYIQSCDSRENSHITLYPNPSQGIINLYFSEAQNSLYQIEVFNSIGEKMENIKTYDNKIDLQYLADGIYLIYVKKNNELHQFKCVLHK